MTNTRKGLIKLGIVLASASIFGVAGLTIQFNRSSDTVVASSEQEKNPTEYVQQKNQ